MSGSDWLQPEDWARLREIGGGRFEWSAGTDAVSGAATVIGRWAPASGLVEINVCLLSDPPGRSVVGVYPRREGFVWTGREPSRDGSRAFATGTFDHVVELADDWAREH